MPITGGEYGPSLAAEILDVGVDDRYEIVACRHAHGSTREEIVLGIDEEQCRLSVRLWNDSWV
jgi:hypothetical protein